ncbi:FecR family protein [Planctobacterium marinum]|uniref:FecR family protein n=1 Tax=Planctobacterium marinum TaxID=1631968 RepID=UPI001E3A6342|nr:FecR domain-containing protein [Planctobacterium marinum]MCC2607388.1 FecR domain-containing protein [Planctobacterium marinum]
MNKVTPLISKEQIQEQACEWISRIDRGLEDRERNQLQLWIKQSDNHQSSLFEMAALWDDLSVMHELSGLFPLAEKSNADAQQSRVFLSRPFMATAASFALLCSIMFMWMQWQPQSDIPQQVQAQSQVHETSVGEQKTIALGDGSLIALNTNSAVEVNLGDKVRSIKILSGEAHFEVAPDANRPFVVAAGQNKVTAIGTAFNVQLLENKRFELLVTEGKVLVSEINQSMPDDIHKLKTDDFSALGTIMVSGDTAVFDGFFSEPMIRLSLDQVQRNLSWQQGMLVFQGESLEYAIAEMNRYTAKQFVLKDEVIKARRVAGYFKVGDTEGLLHALQNNFAIEHEVVGGVIYLNAAQSH